METVPYTFNSECAYANGLTSDWGPWCVRNKKCCRWRERAPIWKLVPWEEKLWFDGCLEVKPQSLWSFWLGPQRSERHQFGRRSLRLGEVGRLLWLKAWVTNRSWRAPFQLHPAIWRAAEENHRRGTQSSRIALHTDRYVRVAALLPDYGQVKITLWLTVNHNITFTFNANPSWCRGPPEAANQIFMWLILISGTAIHVGRL